MATFTLELLKNEVENDPQTLGYKNSSTSGDWKGDQEIADLINNKNLTITRSQVDSEELSQAIEKSAFLTLSPSETDWLVWITNSQTIIVNANLVDALYGSGTIFGGGTGTVTRAALQAVIEAAGSRAEALWGQGIDVQLGQIGRAFNLI